MIQSYRPAVLGKIAREVDRALALRARTGAPGGTTPTRLAHGAGWCVDDVMCTSGPGDRPFEEEHRSVSIAIVLSGTFEYRASSSGALMTPGSLLLGNPGQSFECVHAHGAGDRCIAFRFSPELFERLGMDAGAPGGRASSRFRAPRLPPLKASAPLVAQAALGVAAPAAASESWEELAYRLAAATLALSSGAQLHPGRPPAAVRARIADSVRRIEREPGAPWTLKQLAHEAALSPFHYLRTFKRVAGVTPHQFILRARLRAAALHVAADEARIIDAAGAAGFEDLSNFNHAFRAEFGVAPRTYRRIASRRPHGIPERRRTPRSVTTTSGRPPDPPVPTA
jgi:AraC family transcriptional regulator